MEPSGVTQETRRLNGDTPMQMGCRAKNAMMSHIRPKINTVWSEKTPSHIKKLVKYH